MFVSRKRADNEYQRPPGPVLFKREQRQWHASSSSEQESNSNKQQATERQQLSRLELNSSFRPRPVILIVFSLFGLFVLVVSQTDRQWIAKLSIQLAG